MAHVERGGKASIPIRCEAREVLAPLGWRTLKRPEPAEDELLARAGSI